MTVVADIPADALATVVGADHQHHAARMAQDAFSQVFRLTAAGDADGVELAVTQLVPLCRNWAQAGGSDDARAVRLALLATGLDQWGVAYSRVFGLTAIPGLTDLLGRLRDGLDPAAEARFQQQFDRIGAEEGAAIDFKMALRRNIHLALWHAMLACGTQDEADAILRGLGGLMVGLVEQMPRTGWRLVADALAHIQIRCLAEGAAADGLARESNERFFASLRHALPADRAAAVFEQANLAAVAWHRARKAH